jgi:hypothetical protein
MLSCVGQAVGVGRSSVRRSAELVLLILNLCTPHTLIDEIEEEEGDDDDWHLSVMALVLCYVIRKPAVKLPAS